MIEGEAFQTGSGKSDRAVLEVIGNVVQVRLVNETRSLTQASRSDLTISQRVASIPRRITFQSGMVFVTHDNDAVDRELGGTSGFFKGVGWLEAFHPRLIVIAIVTIGVVFGAYQYGLPLAAWAAAEFTPPGVSKALAQASLQSLDRSAMRPTKLSESERARITADFEKLVSFASPDLQASNPQLIFRDSRVGPNAFALPDGTVVMTDDLVEEFNHEVVKGVLAHELGHVEYQHGLNLLYRSIGVFALISVVAGDAAGLIEAILSQGAVLLTLSYSREYESQADRYAVALLDRAGEDPHALYAFFEKLAEYKRRDQDGEPSEGGSSLGNLLSTHPTDERRIREIKEEIEALDPQ